LTTQKTDVEEIFLASVQKDPAGRQAFLEETCADSQLRTRVEALLKAHDSAGSFLEGPAVQSAPLAGAQDPPAHGSDPTAARESLDFLDRCDTPGRLGLLAHYEILDILGCGGMGIVLRGLDVKLNRVVAIKVLAPQLAANATARRRFLREAQAAAAVSHEHVVAIYAVDEFKGLPYLVMECIAGSSLQQKIDGGALELAQILRIGTQIASGLAAAHAQGLVHRDIKPANILLENGVERVKITDFGLARSVDDVRITQAGKVYGTPLYMSPEQAHGERVDQRSDLFSLGSVLYAMSTGRPPFRGETGLAVLKRVSEDTPRPIQEVNPEIPAALVETVNKLLAKNPDARFQSAGEVADLLGQCLSELQQHGRVDSPGSTLSPLRKPTSAVSESVQGQRPKSEQRTSHGRWLAMAAMILMLLAGIGLTEAAGVTNVRGTVIRLFSPDGTLVVEVDDPGVSVGIDGGEIVITGAGAKEIRLKPGPHKLVTSKDGKPVRQELVTITKNGRQVVRVSREGQSVAIGDEPTGTPAHHERKSAAPVDKATVAAATPGPAAVSRRAKHPAGATDRPVKVFVLAGDSNMAGRAKVELLNYQANQPETKERFRHLLDGSEWVVREDVWVKNFQQKGSLTVGFGQEPSMFGPELEFGNVVGNQFAEQVLLIKTCWGGSLFANFRSPSSGPPDQAILDSCRAELQVVKPNPTPAEVEAHCGAMYREMLTEIRQTLANLGEHFPNYQGQGYEIAGFVWFQGWNDVVNPQIKSNYSELLAHFIRDVRSDFKAPQLPFVIGQLGHYGGSAAGTNDSNFRAAQAAVAELPEFAGNVKLVKTDPFWDHEAEAVYKKGWENHRDEWNKVGSDRPYHYLGSAKTFCGIGKAFGEGMIELCPSGAKN
jgi:serine/threonine protein kinase